MTYHGRYFDPLQLDPERMIAEMRALLNDIGHTVFCSPGHEERLRDTVAGAGLDHLVTVRATPELDDTGDVYVFANEVLTWPLRNVFPRWRPDRSPFVPPADHVR